MRPHIAFLVALAVGVIGCGKKTPESTYAISDFEHPSPQLVQDIARKQGWKIEDVEARERVWNALDAGRKPSEADCQRLILAADTESNHFDLSLAMMFSRHMTDAYRGPVLKWCERNMAQTNSRDAAVVAYDCYVRSGGSDKELWASRLKARGPFYVEKVDFYDKRAEERKKHDGN